MMSGIKKDEMPAVYMQSFHAVIIGAGPAGTAAAKTLAAAGKAVALVCDDLGGECLNYGCIPTKTYLWTCEMLEKLGQAQNFGIEFNAQKTAQGLAQESAQKKSEPVQRLLYANWDAMKERRIKIVSKLKKGLEFTLTQAGVKIIRGRGKILDANTVEITFLNKQSLQTTNYRLQTTDYRLQTTDYRLQTTDYRLQTNYIIIATGANPLFPEDFEPNEHIVSNREILDLPSPPKTLLIIGGGVIGVEFASIFAALGTRVTIAEKSDRLLSFADPDISAELERVFARKNIKILKGARIFPAETDEYEKTLIAVGRKPNIDALGLENAGVKSDRKGIQTNEFMRTNIKNIYAIGDAAGKMLLAYTAEREGEIAAQAILGKKPAILRYETVASAIFSLPEIASCGLTETQAKEKGLNYAIGKSPYSANARALIMGCRDGLAKIIVEKTAGSSGSTGKILGIHIIGEKASEIIAHASLALTNNMAFKTFAQNIYAHPVLGETLKEACAQICLVNST